MKEMNLELEDLEPRIVPGLLDCVTITVPTVYCPPPPPPEDYCPPPPDSDGGNNGYGNDGFDGVPGSSADNDSPNAGEKEADIVR